MKELWKSVMHRDLSLEQFSGKTLGEYYTEDLPDGPNYNLCS